jgi:hypothetical protein
MRNARSQEIPMISLILQFFRRVATRTGCKIDKDGRFTRLVNPVFVAHMRTIHH